MRIHKFTVIVGTIPVISEIQSYEIMAFGLADMRTSISIGIPKLKLKLYLLEVGQKFLNWEFVYLGEFWGSSI